MKAYYEMEFNQIWIVSYYNDLASIETDNWGYNYTASAINDILKRSPIIYLGEL